MRQHGSCSDYINDRNKALLKAYREIMSSPEVIHWKVVIRRVVDSPSPRFWVSEEQAKNIIDKMMAGREPNIRTATKKEMFELILKRVQELRMDNPGMSVKDAVYKVVNSPAPKFYLTEKSAYVIIQRAKKKCYEERRQRLRHFLQGVR